jgi:hypothetical protein
MAMEFRGVTLTAGESDGVRLEENELWRSC